MTMEPRANIEYLEEICRLKDARIKELKDRVAELEAEVEDLRATNEALALPEGSVLIASFDWSEAAEAKDD